MIVVDPLFWLGLSILLVAASLAAVLVAALPAFRELARAARSAEKLFDTLSRELPPTLEAIRLTSLEITELKEDMSDGVQSAGHVVQQIDQSISGVKQQAKQAQSTTRGLIAGVKAAWKSWNRPTDNRSFDSSGTRKNIDSDAAELEVENSSFHRSPANTRPILDLDYRDANQESENQDRAASKIRPEFSASEWDEPIHSLADPVSDRRSEQITERANLSSDPMRDRRAD